MKIRTPHKQQNLACFKNEYRHRSYVKVGFPCKQWNFACEYYVKKASYAFGVNVDTVQPTYGGGLCKLAGLAC